MVTRAKNALSKWKGGLGSKKQRPKTAETTSPKTPRRTAPVKMHKPSQVAKRGNPGSKGTSAGKHLDPTRIPGDRLTERTLGGKKPGYLKGEFDKAKARTEPHTDGSGGTGRFGRPQRHHQRGKDLNPGP